MSVELNLARAPQAPAPVVIDPVPVEQEQDLVVHQPSCFSGVGRAVRGIFSGCYVNRHQNISAQMESALRTEENAKLLACQALTPLFEETTQYAGELNLSRTCKAFKPAENIKLRDRTLCLLMDKPLEEGVFQKEMVNFLRKYAPLCKTLNPAAYAQIKARSAAGQDLRNTVVELVNAIAESRYRALIFDRYGNNAYEDERNLCRMSDCREICIHSPGVLAFGGCLYMLAQAIIPACHTGCLYTSYVCLGCGGLTCGCSSLLLANDVYFSRIRQGESCRYACCPCAPGQSRIAPMEVERRGQFQALVVAGEAVSKRLKQEEAMRLEALKQEARIRFLNTASVDAFVKDQEADQNLLIQEQMGCTAIENQLADILAEQSRHHVAAAGGLGSRVEGDPRLSQALARSRQEIDRITTRMGQRQQTIIDITEFRLRQQQRRQAQAEAAKQQQGPAPRQEPEERKEQDRRYVPPANQQAPGGLAGLD
jgi:hypothetical protein